MARPRLFDEGRALDAATHLFWDQGYEATSTEDLCRATGLGRSSIYNTFSSKRDLFLRALAHYLDEMARRQDAILEDPGTPVPTRIRAVLASVIDIDEADRRDGRGIGCLGVNSVVELGRRDAEVADLLDRDTARRLASLGSAIAAGQAAGEVSRARPPEEAARFVNAVIAGMRVAARGGADRAALESVAAFALDALAP